MKCVDALRLAVRYRIPPASADNPQASNRKTSDASAQGSVLHPKSSRCN
ncbi:hypothetical protein [Nostoc sp. 106C]|nr:hypothetical protein [Nostoc sp. 106C]